jgi:hypothetical protein
MILAFGYINIKSDTFFQCMYIARTRNSCYFLVRIYNNRLFFYPKSIAEKSCDRGILEIEKYFLQAERGLFNTYSAIFMPYKNIEILEQIFNFIGSGSNISMMI